MVKDPNQTTCLSQLLGPGRKASQTSRRAVFGQLCAQCRQGALTSGNRCMHLCRSVWSSQHGVKACGGQWPAVSSDANPLLTQGVLAVPACCGLEARTLNLEECGACSGAPSSKTQGESQVPVNSSAADVNLKHLGHTAFLRSDNIKRTHKIQTFKEANAILQQHSTVISGGKFYVMMRKRTSCHLLVT